MSLSASSIEGNEFYLEGGDEVVGDAEVLNARQVGGHDYFEGDDYEEEGYVAFGDAYEMSGSSVGGNDYFSGGDFVGYWAGVEPTGISIDSIFLGVSGAVFAGDALNMSGSARGGDDEMYGGDNSLNIFAGDALDNMSQASRGGNDHLYGGRTHGDGYSVNLLLGDAYFFGLDSETRVSTSASTPAAVIGGNDYIAGGDAYAIESSAFNINVLAGDAYAIGGRSAGGSDEVHGGDAYALYGLAGALNVITGDGLLLEGRVSGAADSLHGGDAYALGGDAYAINIMAGDAYAFGNGARAGSDTMYGGNAGLDEIRRDSVSILDDGGISGVINLLAGDGFTYGPGVRFGTDLLVGGSGSDWGDGYAVNQLFGDIGDLSDLLGGFYPDGLGIAAATADGLLSALGPIDRSDSSRALKFANDTLVGGEEAAENLLVGDGPSLYEGAVGGADTLIAGGWGTDNVLIGDAFYLYEGAAGGADKLISGEGDDQMWGDASVDMMGRGGTDRFCFAANNGNDVVHDFRVSDRDVIDLRGFDRSGDFRNFKTFASSDRMEQTREGVLLRLDDEWVDVGIQVQAGNTVMLVGVDLTDLAARSFLF